MPSTRTDRFDGLTTSVAVKAPCRVATTANITLSGEQTIDGVAVVAEDRVLVKDQTTGADNGIYVCKATTWERAKDFDGSRDAVTGTLVPVNSGTVGAGFIFKLTTTGTITIGTTSLTFTASTFTDLAVSVFWQGVLGQTSTATTLAALGIPAFSQTVIASTSAPTFRAAQGFPSTGVTDGVLTINSSGMYRGSTITTLSTDGALRGHYAGVSRTTSTALTLASSDAGTIIMLAASATAIVTLPSSTSTVLNRGFQVALAQESTASISIAVQTADSPLKAKSSRNVLSAQYSLATVIKHSSTAGSWLAAGDLST